MIAALFPGQNSHTIGMGKDFYEQSPAARRVLDDAETALPGLLQLMWEGPLETLTLTANQQPALVAAAAAAFAAYREAGGALPRYGAGHSLGEYSSYVAAGALGVTDAVALVNKRGQYMQDAVSAGVGAMAAVLKVGRDVIEQVCYETGNETAGIVEIANLNTPEQTVISGEAAVVSLASERLKEAGARVIPLNVSAPFHCSLMQPAADKLAHDLVGVPFREPSFQIICNVTAEVLPDASDIPHLLTEQVTAPVRWTETIEKLDVLGVTHYLEFGSGKVLTGLVGRILNKPKAIAITDMTSLTAALELIGS